MMFYEQLAERAAKQKIDFLNAKVKEAHQNICNDAENVLNLLENFKVDFYNLWNNNDLIKIENDLQTPYQIAINHIAQALTNFKMSLQILNEKLQDAQNDVFKEIYDKLMFFINTCAERINELRGAPYKRTYSPSQDGFNNLLLPLADDFAELRDFLVELNPSKPDDNNNKVNSTNIPTNKNSEIHPNYINKEQENHLSKHPTAILLHIFSFLNVKDASRFARTSKNNYEASKEWIQKERVLLRKILHKDDLKKPLPENITYDDVYNNYISFNLKDFVSYIISSKKLFDLQEFKELIDDSSLEKYSDYSLKNVVDLKSAAEFITHLKQKIEKMKYSDEEVYFNLRQKCSILIDFYNKSINYFYKKEVIIGSKEFERKSTMLVILNKKCEEAKVAYLKKIVTAKPELGDLLNQYQNLKHLQNISRQKMSLKELERFNSIRPETLAAARTNMQEESYGENIIDHLEATKKILQLETNHPELKKITTILDINSDAISQQKQFEYIKELDDEVYDSVMKIIYQNFTTEYQSYLYQESAPEDNNDNIRSNTL